MNQMNHKQGKVSLEVSLVDGKISLDGGKVFVEASLDDNMCKDFCKIVIDKSMEGFSLSDMLCAWMKQESVGGPSPLVEGEHEFTDLLARATFKNRGTAVARMIDIFEETHRQKPHEFHKILNVCGRYRKYFAKSEDEILVYSNTAQPREIPGSGYWVMTNSSTPLKQQIIRSALASLNYSEAAIDAAVAAIA